MMSYGGGARACLGQYFARTEVKVGEWLLGQNSALSAVTFRRGFSGAPYHPTALSRVRARAGASVPSAAALPLDAGS